MKRKDFLKRSTMAGLSFTFLGKAIPHKTTCDPTPDETEGPFATHKPGKLITQNIKAGKAGTPLIINIGINNINDNCAGLAGVIVDIWHCDSKGEYSEYGGKHEHGNHGGPNGMHMPPPGGAPPETHFPNDSLMKRPGIPPPGMMGGGSMQAADHVKEHFLRGRQTTNAHGLVSFHSIYPGWYSSRAPHIHLHIYNADGKSLLVTQVAFPEEVSKAVYSQGVYSSHGLPDTTNANDNVFFDSLANELATITGNPADGYILNHSIYIKA
jgi:protocatechuate 3,4-dioxygenase beta subunit